MPDAAGRGREITATLLVSGCAPPIPSICRGSGVPMTRSSRSSRSAGPAGRSSARKYAPLDVPPRMSMQGMPAEVADLADLADLAELADDMALLVAGRP